MTTSKFTTTVLTADENCFLTQSGELESPAERVIATRVALGKNDNASNWKEISAEEAQAYREEMEAQRAADAERALNPELTEPQPDPETEEE